MGQMGKAVGHRGPKILPRKPETLRSFFNHSIIADFCQIPLASLYSVTFNAVTSTGGAAEPWCRNNSPNTTKCALNKPIVAPSTQHRCIHKQKLMSSGFSWICSTVNIYCVSASDVLTKLDIYSFSDSARSTNFLYIFFTCTCLWKWGDYILISHE